MSNESIEKWIVSGIEKAFAEIQTEGEFEKLITAATRQSIKDTVERSVQSWNVSFRINAAIAEAMGKR